MITMAQEQLKGRLIFEQSEKTLACVKALRGVNHEISYNALSQVVGFPVVGSTPALQSARKHLEKFESIVFECVYREGLRRLSDIDKGRSTARHARQIKRTARRGRKRHATIEKFEELPPAIQIEVTLRDTQFQFVESAMVAPKTTQPANNDLSDVLKAFKNR